MTRRRAVLATQLYWRAYRSIYLAAALWVVCCGLLLNTARWF